MCIYVYYCSFIQQHKKRHEKAESLQGIRQLNKSLRICDIRLMTSEIALRQLYSPYGELRIYLI